MSVFVDPAMAMVRAAGLTAPSPDDEVFWQPSPKQKQLLAADDFKALDGGAPSRGNADAPNADPIAQLSVLACSTSTAERLVSGATASDRHCN